MSRDTEPRSGGKIGRDRRPRVSGTPYDRPSGSIHGWYHNWLSSATRKIADSAGRLLKSVLWSRSDSDTDDSGSDVQMDADAYSKDFSSLETTTKNKSLDDEGGIEKDYFLMECDKQTKRAIVMLLLQETFSKEENDRLINIIESRIVDNVRTDDARDKRPSTAPSTADEHVNDVCCALVLEARKWISERKLRSASKSLSQSSLTSCSYSHTSSPDPVEVARSYMRSCTPSPVSNSLLPIRMQQFSEISPYRSNASSVSSKVRQDHLTPGSCKSLQEIGVCSKVTEGLFINPSADKDSLAFTFNDSILRTSTVIDNTEVGLRDTELELQSVMPLESTHESLDLAQHPPSSDSHSNAVQKPQAAYDQEEDLTAVFARSSLPFELDTPAEPRSCVGIPVQTVNSNHERGITSPAVCQFQRESEEIPVNEFLTDGMALDPDSY